MARIGLATFFWVGDFCTYMKSIERSQVFFWARMFDSLYLCLIPTYVLDMAKSFSFSPLNYPPCPLSLLSKEEVIKETLLRK